MAEGTLQNQDVLGIVNRIDDVVEELGKSQSSGVSGMIEPDTERLDACIVQLKTYKAWAVGQPLQDLPRTHPESLEVPPLPPVPTIENNSIIDIVVMLNRARQELIMSQSARLASTLLPFDATRFDKVIAKLEAFLF